MLSLLPALEGMQTAAQSDPALTVATLADRIAVTCPGVERIRRGPSGQITAFYFDLGQPGGAVIDPTTGAWLADYEPSAFQRWVTNLHRSLILGDAGRWAAAAGAASLLLLSVSGVLLTLRRVGGWRRIFSRLRGPQTGRLHVEIARVTVAGLLLSSITALFMTASTFDILLQISSPAFPTKVSGETGIQLGAIALLGHTRVDSLRELTFPYPDDTSDVFTLKIDSGEGYIDQETGAVLVWADAVPWQQFIETIYMLHTGQGMALPGVLLGLMALGAPFMAITGVMLWLKARHTRPRIHNNVATRQADTILLVGSERGSTWGFAATLHAGLTAAGHKVHAAPLSLFAPQKYSAAKRLIVLAATYGAGAAPASAKGFLNRLASLPANPEMPLAVLGLGDRNFFDFCAYAARISRTADERGWRHLIPMATIDRQSPQEFARWGHTLGAAIGTPLELSHSSVIPHSHALSLTSRRDYGGDMQTQAGSCASLFPKPAFGPG